MGASSQAWDLRYAVEDPATVLSFRVSEPGSVRSVLESIASARATLCVHAGATGPIRCWLDAEGMADGALIVRVGAGTGEPWYAGDVATSLPGSVKVQLSLLAPRPWHGVLPPREGSTVTSISATGSGRAVVATVLRERLTPGAARASAIDRTQLWMLAPPSVVSRIQRRNIFRAQPIDSLPYLMLGGVSLPLSDFSERGVGVYLPADAPRLAVGELVPATIVFDRSTLYPTTVRVCWVRPGHGLENGRAGLLFDALAAPVRAALTRRSVEAQSVWRRRRG